MQLHSADLLPQEHSGSNRQLASAPASLALASPACSPACSAAAAPAGQRHQPAMWSHTPTKLQPHRQDLSPRGGGAEGTGRCMKKALHQSPLVPRQRCAASSSDIHGGANGPSPAGASPCDCHTEEVRRGHRYWVCVSCAQAEPPTAQPFAGVTARKQPKILLCLRFALHSLDIASSPHLRC